MLSSGFVICLGLVIWFVKCSWSTRINIISYGVWIDVFVMAALTAIHWGTFSGVMAATVGAVMVSALLEAGAVVFGRIKNKKYIRGWIDIYPYLNQPKR